ncbi:peptidase E [Intrasporangium calvum]|uniref:Peptidase E n=1 Tax=Intrasporangium calvum TaxID=53358 RepID=A0ABT5GDQ3_9MICO|nr:Type 1 glutamine amidotransferase-like domain-containing protein [Intrasporangium calvum]MDC5696349.1 peptidase E [Intrasporangium calvum]
MTTILLGPQRFTTTAQAVLRSLSVDGPVAMVNAGWEEREVDDAELDGVLDHRGFNLRLYQRAVEVLAADRALRRAVLEHRACHAELRAFYGLRLQAAWDTVLAVRRRPSRLATDDVRDGAVRSAMQALRDVDDWYAYEVARIVEGTATSDVVRSSEALARHREEVAEAIAAASVVVLAGGHVGILMETLRLLDVSVPAEKPVIAWSAGAMALCDPVVLFHDFAPQGVTAPEVHDRGLGRLRGIVPLPHARRRLALDDRERMTVFAERFPAHHLLPLDDGTVLRFEATPDRPDARVEPPEGARFIGRDGTVETWGAR